MSIESRNAAAMRAGQWRHDNAAPDDREIPEQYIEQAEEEFDEDAPRHKVLARAAALMEADAKQAAEDAAVDRYELSRDW